MLLSSGAPKTFGVKLSFLLVLSSIGFPKETPTLLLMNIEKGELLTSNSLKSGVDWLRFQYRNRRKGKSAPRLLMLSSYNMYYIAMLTDS